MDDERQNRKALVMCLESDSDPISHFPISNERAPKMQVVMLAANHHVHRCRRAGRSLGKTISGEECLDEPFLASSVLPGACSGPGQSITMSNPVR